MHAWAGLVTPMIGRTNGEVRDGEGTGGGSNGWEVKECKWVYKCGAFSAGGLRLEQRRWVHRRWRRGGRKK